MRENLRENLNVGWESQQWEDKKGEGEVCRRIYMELQLEARCWRMRQTRSS
jgi:hypothetical protein